MTKVTKEEKKNSYLKNAALVGTGALAVLKGPQLIQGIAKAYAPKPSFLEKAFNGIGKIASGTVSGIADRAAVGASLLATLGLGIAGLYVGKTALKGKGRLCPSLDLMHNFDKLLSPLGNATDKARSTVLNFWNKLSSTLRP